MDKLKLHTPDFVEANAARLAELFPNCVTESTAEDGTIKRAIDFDLLRQELSSDVVEGPQERYRLDWPGKREALALANAPISKTLRPCNEESVDFEATQNLYIEGDNLDALKLLQETYLGKVKMIYIDPPYNTGNDFIYDDNFSMSREEYEEVSGEKDEEGNAMFDEEKWQQNFSANGRFHSEWTSMLYPRLKLARNLLQDNGIIFISIDDGEVANLRQICDEVFGSSNALEPIIWKKRYQGAKEKHLVSVHEYILVYAKSKELIEPIYVPATKDYIDRYYTNKDDNFNIRGGYRTQPLEAGKSMDGRSNLKYSITAPNGEIIYPKRQWVWSENRFLDALEHGEIGFAKLKHGSYSPFIKQYLLGRDGVIRKTKKQTIIDDVFTQNGTKEIAEIFEGKQIFPFPKPSKLIIQLLEIGLGDDQSATVLDFFSGSAASAHAVINLNARDGGSRRHIMIQLPEPCGEKTDAAKAGYKTIAEIGKERIRRAGAKIRAELETQLEGELPESDKHKEISAKLANLDTGFRVLKVDTSNMTDVYYRPDEVTQDGLGIQVENIKQDRSPEDLLFQVLLDWGVDLALPIEQESISGKTVFFVGITAGDGAAQPGRAQAIPALAACFDTGLDEDFIKELAKRTPLRAVFRDASFKDDATKINIEQIFKALRPHTELKTI